jgi:hypothetical protein
MKRLLSLVMALLVFSIAVNWLLKGEIENLEGIVKSQAALLRAQMERENALKRAIAEILKERRHGEMQDPVLLNGKPRCTLIQRFGSGGVVIIGPRAAIKREFDTLHDAEEYANTAGWVVGISHPTLINKEA